jgi:flagellar hook-associated protein 2
VHGFTVTSSSNSVTDVIEGVTLDLTGLGKAQMDSSRDTTSLRASVDAFVSSYNSMATTLTNLSTSQLQGDALPRGIDRQMRDAFLGAIDLGNDSSTTALELGFSFDRYGTLSVNETNFNDALEKGVERYVTAFSRPDTGLANRFIDLVSEYTGAGGIIDGREDGIDTRQSSIDDQIDRLEYRIDKSSERLRRQYTAMDQIVTNLQSTSSFLISRLSS